MPVGGYGGYDCCGGALRLGGESELECLDGFHAAQYERIVRNKGVEPRGGREVRRGYSPILVSNKMPDNCGWI